MDDESQQELPVIVMNHHTIAGQVGGADEVVDDAAIASFVITRIEAEKDPAGGGKFVVRVAKRPSDSYETLDL